MLNADKTFNLSHPYSQEGIYLITVTVTDDKGIAGSANGNLVVKNVGPTATGISAKVGGLTPAVYFEGDQIDLHPLFSDPGNDTFTYRWHLVAGNGQAIADGNSQDFNFAPNDNGTYFVFFTVTDEGGLSGSTNVSLSVANVAPTATFGNTGPIGEGQAATVTFTNQQDVSSVDAASGYLYSFDFNNDGVFEVVDSTVSSASLTFAEEGSYSVKGRIKDKDKGFTDYTTTVTVNDAALSGSINSFSAIEGVPFSGLVASFTDANPKPDLADLSASIDWGDGHSGLPDKIVANGAGGFDVYGTHTYLIPGSPAVKVTINDAGGSSISPTAKVSVLPVADLALLTTVDASRPTEGQTIHYSITIDNKAGPEAATGVAMF